MTKKLNEDTLTEQPVIEWLKEMGYDYEFGPDENQKLAALRDLFLPKLMSGEIEAK